MRKRVVFCVSHHSIVLPFRNLAHIVALFLFHLLYSFIVRLFLIKTAEWY